jgi:prevent-host-death family protein
VSKSKGGEIPVYHSVTEFLKGQASRIFKEVNEQDKVLIVNKQNKPQAVIISYDRYKRLKEKENNDI